MLDLLLSIWCWWLVLHVFLGSNGRDSAEGWCTGENSPQEKLNNYFWRQKQFPLIPLSLTNFSFPTSLPLTLTLTHGQ
jgi:hypothetical protein